MRRARRARPLRHSDQAAPRKRIEWPLAKPAEASYGPPAPGDDNLAAPLYSLQVLAEAIMELSDSDLGLGPM
jgi:hypothetical protein